MKYDFLFIISLVTSLISLVVAYIWYKDKMDERKYEPILAIITILSSVAFLFINSNKEGELKEINQTQALLKEKIIDSLEKEKIILSEKLSSCINQRRESNTVINNDIIQKKPFMEQVVLVNDYLKTNIQIEKNDRIFISATGSINVGAFVGHSGPDGKESGLLGFNLANYNIIKRYKHASLIYKIGKEDDWTECGSEYQFQSTMSGYLYFEVNDLDKSNNRGEYHVNVKVFR